MDVIFKNFDVKLNKKCLVYNSFGFLNNFLLLVIEV